MLRSALLVCACSTTSVVGLGHARAETASLDAEEPAAGNALGLGLSLGQPTKLSLKYMLPKVPMSLSAGLGTGIWNGKGLHLDASVAWEKAVGSLQISLGAGYRHYDHDFVPSSLDELGRDTHDGLMVLMGVSWVTPGLPIEVFGELMPGIDFAQTESCTFASGVNSICPHQDQQSWFFNMGVGARYWFQL